MASFTSPAGQLDAQQIRGWMTLADISSGYKIPLSDLYAALGLPARVSPNTRLNRIQAEHKVEFEPEKARDLVDQVLTGKPAVSLAAAQKPAAKPRPQAVHQPKKSPGAGKGAGQGEEPEVRGFMTLNEVVLKTGVPKAYILKELGLSEGEVDARQPLRDWVHQKGKSVPELREIITKYRRQKK
jgi:hypothetical protein